MDSCVECRNLLWLKRDRGELSMNSVYNDDDSVCNDDDTVYKDDEVKYDNDSDNKNNYVDDCVADL